MTKQNIELKEKSNLDIVVAKKLLKIQQSASNRKINFSMTFTKVKRLLITEKCFFTGITLNVIENDPNQLTFDRLDNDKGYTDENVVVCTREFNEIKGNITIDQLKLMVKGLKRKKLW